MVTHDPGLAQGFATRMVRVVDGRVAEDLTTTGGTR
jgi:hypothetical protein